MPRTRLATCAPTRVLVEDVVLRAGVSRRKAADALAGVAVEVSVRAAVLSSTPVPTRTLTGLQVQFLIQATHIR